MRAENLEIAHARFGQCSHTCFADLPLVLFGFSAARTTQAAGLLQNESGFSRRSTPHIYSRLLRRAGSSASHSHSTDPASRHSGPSGACHCDFFSDCVVSSGHRGTLQRTDSFTHKATSTGSATVSNDSWSAYLRAASAAEKAAPELAGHSGGPASRHSGSSSASHHGNYGEPSVSSAHRILPQHPASPLHEASSTGAAAGSKDSWSAYMRAASAAEKAAPELFEEVTSRPTSLKRPGSTLTEEEKRRRRIETVYRSNQRAKGLVVPAAPGYADRTGKNRGKLLKEKDLASIPVQPLSVPVARLRFQRANDGAEGSSASLTTNLPATSRSTPGNPHLLSPSHERTEPAAEAARRLPATSANSNPELPEEKTRRLRRESKERQRLRKKGIAVPYLRPGYGPRTGEDQNKPQAQETPQERKSRLAKERRERTKLTAAETPVPSRPGGIRSETQAITGPSGPETPEESKRRLAKESRERTRLRAAGKPVPPRPGYESRTGEQRNKSGVPNQETLQEKRRRYKEREKLRKAGVPVPVIPGYESRTGIKRKKDAGQQAQ